MNEKNIQIVIYRADEIPASLFQKLTESPDRLIHDADGIYVLLNQTVICCEDTPAGNELIYSICLDRENSHDFPNDTAAVMKRILNDPYYIPEQTVQIRHKLFPFGKRCAVVFRAYMYNEKDLYHSFVSIAPVEKNDLIISVDFQTIIFVRTLKDEGIDELAEYADAVIGTMESEGIIGIRAGIGCVASDITEMRSSYLQGCKALQIGFRHSKKQHVYIYARQTLERIVDCIPAERKTEIRNQFFKTDASRKLSDEMIETVRVFFQNDLNLTAASRQLFIHRNTLNYRLDKIKKEFGLDLRSFQDAVVFRIITEIQDEP